MRRPPPPVDADYLDMLDASDIEPLGMPTPEAIWEHVFPRALYVSRHEGEVYLQLACECAWEEEHGLQLVYRRGERLTRVSQQDGHVTD